jgi:hypothetical protein
MSSIYAGKSLDEIPEYFCTGTYQRAAALQAAGDSPWGRHPLPCAQVAVQLKRLDDPAGFPNQLGDLFKVGLDHG